MKNLVFYIRSWRWVWALCLLACWSVPAHAQNRTGGSRPLEFLQNQYRLRAGDRLAIVATQETLAFLRTAKTRIATAGQDQHRGFAVGPSVNGDQVLLAASLTTKPGNYTLTVSATSHTGEVRAAAVDITLDPMQPVPNGSTVPPVILLNGWQFPTSIGELLSAGTCPVSQVSDTFGDLGTELAASPSGSARNTAYPTIDGEGAVVYFFDNCVEDPNGLIENLGNVLGQVLNLITYQNGTLVPQVDLVTHSMGGLIARAYLSGLQTNGALSPPFNPRVRKLVEIATPNFGSFLAANYSDLVPSGTQTAELVPGSTFLWYLATWNQRGDDLRGVDGLAIIGDSGYWQPNIFSGETSNLSDGVVSITSASIGFVPLSYARSTLRTRVLPYCHVDSASGAGGFIDCTGPGIADAADTAAIVLSFVQNTSLWQTIGNSSQSQYGGVYFALENAAGTQYGALESVSLGSVSFQTGWNDAFFFEEFANGTGTLEATTTSGTSANCGSFSVQSGFYSIARCKYSPSISNVQSNLSTGLPGLTIASGSTLTITGTGFSTGTGVFANGTALPAQILSSSEITASLPSAYGGLVGISVSNSSGADEINIFVAPPAQPPSISLSAAQVSFSYTMSGAAPAAQTLGLSNSGGGTLSWTASSNSSWLTVFPASGTGAGTLTIGVSTVGLSAQSYTGTITISAAGASNSPQVISVSLTVNAAAPSISLSASKVSFNYTLGGSAPSSQTVGISDGGGGTLFWSASSNSSWLTVSPASGTGAGTLSLGINVAGLSAQTYTGAITVTASDASNTPQTISITLNVSSAPVTSPTVLGIVNSASWSNGTVAPGELVTIGGSLLGPSAGLSGSIDPSTGKMQTQVGGVSVTVGGVPAPLLYVSATQINAVVPYEIAGCTQVTLQVAYQGIMSAGTSVPCASAAPGVFTFNASGSGQAAAANQDGTYNGPSSPAPKGSYVTLYFTGGGLTNPPGTTGSISGSTTLKWLTQTASVTVGNVAATVAFDGAAPTYIDGFLQLNIQLSLNTPTGSALPVIVTVGNLSSPATATVAVQ